MGLELEIKDWYSSEIQEVWNWSPKDKSMVYLTLEIEIGEVGKAGTLFQTVVATPMGISSQGKTDSGILSDRNLLLVDDYRWEIVEKRLMDIVKKCSANTWDESIQRLQRYFLWEYEDCRVEDSGEA